VTAVHHRVLAASPAGKILFPSEFPAPQQAGGPGDHVVEELAVIAILLGDVLMAAGPVGTFFDKFHYALLPAVALFRISNKDKLFLTKIIAKMQLNSNHLPGVFIGYAARMRRSPRIFRRNGSLSQRKE
jgi:hypothetical protein